MNLGARLQACGNPRLPIVEAAQNYPLPIAQPACTARPSLAPSHQTFHRGRLPSAHMGRRRAAKPGTQGAWERSASKEPHGQQGPVRPPTWLSHPVLFLSAPSTVLPSVQTLPLEAPQYTPSTQARGHPSPNGNQYNGRYTSVHTKCMHTIQPVCIHPYTNTWVLAHTHTHMKI